MTTLPPEGQQGPDTPGGVPPQQPQYQAPQQPQYQAPQPPQYQAPQPPYAQPPVNPINNLQLNFWLSVFFGWIPALIFFLVDKDKGDQRLRQLHAMNLNFTLLKVFVGIAVWIVGAILLFIPYVGLVLNGLLWVAVSIGPLILHIIAAVKVSRAYNEGTPVDPFLINIPMVK